MLSFSPHPPIANTAATFSRRYDAARRRGVSRQTLSRDAPKILRADRRPRQALADDNARLKAQVAAPQEQLRSAVVFDADRQARFACTAQAEGVSRPVARRLLRIALPDRTPGVAAPARVGRVVGGVWRASSLVGCLNSLARMRQARHRRVTAGLLDLKRLDRSCRAFRTGRRRKTPDELLGVPLPTTDWWELLKWPPNKYANNCPRRALRLEKVPCFDT